MRVSLEELKYLVSLHYTPQNKRFFHSLRSNPSEFRIFLFRYDGISIPHLQQPYGYSDTESGLLGATMLLAGLLAAIITAPLFDRVFTHDLAKACKIFVPLAALGWLSEIWAGKVSPLLLYNEREGLLISVSHSST